jgi:acylphosphatase
MRRCVDVVVSGRVQGVAFRYATEREATRLGVAGWVRNEPDGSVAGHFEGEPDAVASLLAWCEHGPPAPRVRNVSVRAAVDSGATRFDVRV